VSLTKRSNAVPLIDQKGLAFLEQNEGVLLDLQGGSIEPNAEEVHLAVENAYETDERKKISGMGEDDEGVAFAGIVGEPLLALDVLLESAALIKETRHGVPLSLVTNGLVPDRDNEGTARKLGEVGIGAASVFLPTTDPKTYAAIMRPEDEQLNFGSVCDFISQLAAAGIEVECTAIQKPGVDLPSIRALAYALGAQNFKPFGEHDVENLSH